MNINLINSRIMRSSNQKILVVLLIWCFGLLSGIMSSLSFPVNYSLRPYTAIPPVSLIITFLTQIFPVIIAVALAYFNKPIACYALCFVRAFCCGYTGMLLFFQLGSGAWILRFPFMFSGYCSSVVTLAVLFKAFRTDIPRNIKSTHYLVASIFCCCLIDTFIISPCLFSFVNYY